MTANVIEIRDTIFVNDRRYAPEDWEKAFVEFQEIVEIAKHCTQRLRIGMINIDYHPNKHLFVAYGTPSQTIAEVIPLRRSSQIQSATPDKYSVAFGLLYFAEERSKKIWRVNLRGFTLIFLRDEANKLQLIVSGSMPKTSPLVHEDCS